MTTDSSSDGLSAPRYTLEKQAWLRRDLIRDLAEGKLTQVELAEKYGVVQSSVSEFKSRHKEEIEAVRNNLEDEFAGIWIANKERRLAELSSDVEHINESELGKRDPQWAKVKQSALKQAAEELGQIPNRISVQVGDVHVRYEVAGVNLDDLK